MKNRLSDHNIHKAANRGKKKGVRILVGVCALALVAASAYGIIHKLKSGKQDTKATTLLSAQAQIGDVSTSITSSGTLEGKEESVIRVPSGIKIKEVLVSEGDVVRKGTKLASVYPASVAEILLDVKESIETVEDNLDELDEDEISDTSSDDYLKKLAYDQELADLEDLSDQLQEILESGYIKAESAGIVGTINVSDETGTGITSGDTSSDLTYTGSNSTGSVSAVRTAYIANGTGNTGSTASGNPLGATKMTAYARLLSSTDMSDSETGVAGAESYDNNSSSEKTSSGQEVDGSTSDDSEEGTDPSSDSSTSTESGTTDNTGSDTPTDNTGDKSSEGTTADKNQNGKSDTDKKGSSTETPDGASSGKNKDSKGNTSTGNVPSGTQKGFGKQGSNIGNTAISGGNLAAGSTETQTESDTIADIEMEKIFILNSDSQMLVTVSIDEADIGSVQKGQTAQVTLTALPEETFEGVISGISNVSSSSGSSVKYQVEITIDKTDAMLSGMSASAVIYIEKAENALLIPSAAVQERGGQAFVYTQTDSDGSLGGETEVTTGLSDGSQVQITEGLNEGDTVYYEIFSSEDSDNDFGDIDFDKIRDSNGGGFNGNGGPGGMPGTPPSGFPDRGN